VSTSPRANVEGCVRRCASFRPRKWPARSPDSADERDGLVAGRAS
jgi:hypothetical protein